MTPELLKRVADCAPKGMGARHEESYPRIEGPAVVFNYVWAEFTLSVGVRDHWNGAALMLMLDAMENAEYGWAMHGPLAEDGDAPMYRISVCVNSVDSGAKWRWWEGKTRAEAVALAFCAVFEELKEQAER